MKLRPELTTSDSFRTLALSLLHPTARHLATIEVVGLTYKWQEMYSTAGNKPHPIAHSGCCRESGFGWRVCMPWDRPIRSGVKEDDGEFVKSTPSSKSHTRYRIQSRHLIGDWGSL